MPKELPNQREEIILLILMHGEKFGRELRDVYEKRTGRPMPVGSLYTTLDRMEDQGFIESRIGESNPDRGGNRRKYYKIAAPGLKALNDLRQVAGELSRGAKGGLAHA